MSDVRIGARETEDRLAILDIEGEYAVRCDAGDGIGWAELFTEDGVYQWPIIPGMPEAPPPMRGRAEIAAGCTALPGTCMHRVSAPKVTISGDEAVTLLTSCSSGHTSMNTVSVTRAELVAINHTEYVRTPHSWKIRHRVDDPVLDHRLVPLWVHARHRDPRAVLVLARRTVGGCEDHGPR